MSLNIRYRSGKAMQSLKNEGPVAFGKKLGSFSVWAVRRSYVKVNPYLPDALQYKGAMANKEYAFLSNPIFQITAEDIEASKKVQRQIKPEKIESATWFVPYFNHLSFGGIYTIFRFMSGFAERGVATRIVIYDSPGTDRAAMHKEIVATFPALKDAELVIFDPVKDRVEDLPATDIAICTFWVSAYFMLKFNQTKRKYYFIQDYEPLFYSGGSTYALAESTYRFGFNGIVNTPGLLRAVNLRHGLEGVSFVPAIDNRYYFAPKDCVSNKKVKIFFYARPNNPRNAFELGLLIIQQLIETYGHRIEIITAGAEWNEAKYGLKGKVTNLGLIKGLKAVGELYRSCDIGFVYMLSKHPSYQPFEFMTSGMATVTNNNEDNLWFLKDGTNCLVAEPSAAAMAEKISWLIEDEDLRRRIQEGGYKAVSSDWEKQVELIWNDVSKSQH
jgi:glycosyltransferase involved in cell wall biosynthesis